MKQPGNQERQTVEVVPQPLGPGERWRPIVGDESASLYQELNKLELDELDQLKIESGSILGSCVPPKTGDERETGLVFGQVQSGKTMSFTAVTALARDNEYPLVIVVTGTSEPLSLQSKDRLERDLRLPTREDRCWRLLHNPNAESVPALRSSLADWRDPTVPFASRQTVLITVMKNHARLRNLTEALRSLDLKGLPALIVDDEADQAGLNTLVNKGRESTTHQRLRELRDALPHHTYLQYTATPQAPLLINLIDVLSPRFAQVLTPGNDYVGGREFFGTPDLVREIPANQIITPANQLQGPPDSLLEAMRIFFLGVAVGYLVDQARGNRSMMIHPSRETVLHADYARWVVEIQNSWAAQLALRLDDPDRQDLLADFQTAYDDLARTVQRLPEFNSLVQTLPRMIRNTLVTPVNAVRGKTPQIDWKANYSHILVGGQAMDRGFTVNGLTVTYMPRGMGMGNADTVQQRARFFGYKRQYLGFCRIYLEPDALQAYRRYVDHEEDLRLRLAEHRRTGKPLSEWRRAFFLDSGLKPTRKNVLDLSDERGDICDDWFNPDAPHDSPEAIQPNLRAVEEFVKTLRLMPDEGHPARTEPQKHEVATTPLRSAFEKLLTKLKFTRGPDSRRFTGLLLQVAAFLETQPNSACCVYRMSKWELRKRELGADDAIPYLHQGPNKDIYPGDREIRAQEGLTIQLHRLRLTKGNKDAFPDVPCIAVWVPAIMSRAWLVQARPGGKD